MKRAAHSRPSPPALTRALLALLAFALALRLTGIGFGLPNARHAYPYNPDEWTPMQVLKGMDPGRLDFNPHYYFNPTLQYYLYGATFAAAHVAGWINIKGDERFYFQHPENIARMILLGRLWSALFGVATVWLGYRLARRIGASRNTALGAAALLAVQPAHVIHGHFMTVNSPVTFWMTLALLLLVRWLGRPGIVAAALAGAAIGLSITTKFSAGILVPLAGFAALLVWRRRGFGHAMGESVALVVAALAAFVAGTPYAVLAWPEFRDGFIEMTTYFQAGPPPGGPMAGLMKVLRMYFYAVTPGVLLAGIGGLLLPRLRRSAGGLLLIVFIAAFMATTIKAGALASDSRFLPLFPALCVTAALAFAALRKARFALGSAALAVSLAFVALADIAYLGRFIGRMPQETASDWMRSHVTGSPLIHLAGTSIYYFPDLPLRERLAGENPGAYARETEWRFVESKEFATARPANPDVVVLTSWTARKPEELEWLSQPDYDVVATFPGKVNFFGKRWPVPLDLYDTDTWILRR
ncbi:MAG TPA: phospholipid carrier-dependent glycosyltransferase, partial [Candidatus Eisenbacteria bacterium]